MPTHLAEQARTFSSEIGAAPLGPLAESARCLTASLQLGDPDGPPGLERTRPAYPGRAHQLRRALRRRPRRPGPGYLNEWTSIRSNRAPAARSVRAEHAWLCRRWMPQLALRTGLPDPAPGPTSPCAAPHIGSAIALHAPVRAQNARTRRDGSANEAPSGQPAVVRWISRDSRGAIGQLYASIGRAHAHTARPSRRQSDSAARMRRLVRPAPHPGTLYDLTNTFLRGRARRVSPWPSAKCTPKDKRPRLPPAHPGAGRARFERVVTSLQGVSPATFENTTPWPSMLEALRPARWRSW